MGLETLVFFCLKTYSLISVCANSYRKTLINLVLSLSIAKMKKGKNMSKILTVQFW